MLAMNPSITEDAQVLEALVRIPSPTGSEAAAVQHMQQQATNDGLRVSRDSAGNFIAEAGKGERLILFVGHIDTVPGHIPVRLQDGELWGRGAVDAKGPLAAFYCAARALRDDPSLRIMIAGCVDEEGRSAGAKALPRDLKPFVIIVGEPSGADGTTIGYKGILRGRFEATSPVLHGGHPGPTPSDALVAWWSAVSSELAFADGFEDCQGHLDALASSSDGLTARATASFQVRLGPKHDPAAKMEAILRLASARGGHVVFTESMPAAVSDRRSTLVAAFSTAIRAEGMTPRLKRKTGTADFNHLAQWYPGVPMVAYGPGDSHLDHTPEERIGLEEFAAGVRVLERVLFALAKSS